MACRFAGAALLLSCAPRYATAQEVDLVAQIEHVAGADIYMSAGTDDGIRQGDTLTVSTSRRVLGMLIVLETSSHRAITTFAAAPFNLTRGQQVRITFVSHTNVVASSAAGDSVDVAIEKRTVDLPPIERASILDSPERSRPRRSGARQRRMRVHGRVFVDMNSTKTSTPLTTTTGEEQSIDRSYMSPSTGLRLTASDLPGGARFNVNARGTYQTSTGSVSQEIRSVRVYLASLSGFAFRQRAQYEVGRFTSRHEITSGYWDGLLIRFGGRRVGAGVSAGFEPERYNQGLSTDIPKFAGFLNIDASSARTRYNGDVSVVSRRPTNDLLAHTYVSTSQDLRFVRLQFSGDLQVDRDPESGNWVATRVQLRTTIPVQKYISVFGRFSIRQPYAYWRTTNLISYRRDQLSAGFNANVDGVSMGGSVSDNRSDGQSSGRGYGTNFRLSQTDGMPIGISVSANLWTYSNSTTRHLSTGFDRSWGNVRSSLTYTYYDSELLDGLIQSHLLGVSLTVPLLRKTYASAQLRTQIGGYASRTSLYTRLWMSF